MAFILTCLIFKCKVVYFGFIFTAIDKIVENIVQLSLGQNRLLAIKTDPSVYETTAHIVMRPPALDYNGQAITINKTSFNNVVRRSVENATTAWKVKYDPLTERFMLHGPPTTCSLNGTYYIDMLDKDKVTIASFNVTVVVLSKTANTSLTMDQNSDIGYNLTCIQSFGCNQRNQQISFKINDNEVFSHAQESCISFKDDEGFTGRVSTVVPHELASVSSEFACKSTAVVDVCEDVDDIKSKESVIVLGDECDPITCSMNCTRKYGPDYRFAHKSRCDKYWRCAFGVLINQTSAGNTFFDARFHICADSHKVDVPWCNDDGTLKQNEDVSKHICGYDNNYWKKT